MTVKSKYSREVENFIMWEYVFVNLSFKHSLVRKSIVLFICFLSLSVLWGQDTEVYFYKRLEGTINNKYPVVMHITRRGENVSGWYYYSAQKKVLFLDGKILEDGAVTLSEHPRSPEWPENAVTTGGFNGRLGPDNFTGVWQSADLKKSFPFSVTERYGINSGKFELYHMEKTVPLFENDEKSPSMHITTDLLYPKSFPDLKVLAALRDSLSPNAPENPRKSLAADCDSMAVSYRANVDESYDPDMAYMYNWEFENKISVVLNDAGFLCFDHYFYDYAGGAHGNYGNVFSILELTTGERLFLTDIFSPSSFDELGKFIEADIRVKLEIDPGTDISEAGLFVERVEPCENIYMACDGIGFHYNIYEILPYAAGPIDVFLPFEKIKHLIKPDSPVQRLFK